MNGFFSIPLSKILNIPLERGYIVSLSVQVSRYFVSGLVPNLGCSLITGAGINLSQEQKRFRGKVLT